MMPEDVREWVMRGEFVPADRFLAICRNGIGSREGAGCYVILVYGGKRVPRDLSRFSMGYIGQSVNVISRLRDHLTGNGNEKVHSDVKKGRKIMVQVIPCSLESLNDLERALISAFDRGRLYNQTAGGSRTRCHDGSEFVIADRRLLRPWTRTEAPMRRAVFSYADGPSPVLVVVDGVKAFRLEKGSRASMDLVEGTHVVKAKRLGRLSGKRSVKVSEGCEITVKAGRLRLSVTSFRRAPSLDGSSPRTRDRRSEERLSCFLGESSERCGRHHPSSKPSSHPDSMSPMTADKLQ